MEFMTRSPEETEAVGAALAQQLNSGSVIAYRGDLGAGKTAFVTGLAQGLGSNEAVSSPTFALLNQYTDGRIPVYHFDLYRINGEEIYSLGFDEMFFDPNVISCVEWSERLSELDMPEKRIEITILKLDGDNRCFSIKPIGYKEGEFEIC